MEVGENVIGPQNPAFHVFFFPLFNAVFAREGKIPLGWSFHWGKREGKVFFTPYIFFATRNINNFAPVLQESCDLT